MSAIKEPSFRESVDLMFNRAVALMDLPPGLEEKIRVCNATYTVRFGVRLRGQIHTFTEGNTIGLGWVVHDKDSAEEDNGGKSDGGWGINPNIQMWFDCVNCSDFLLAPIDPRVDFSSIPTAVEEESWGRIKAAYIQ